MSTSSQVRPLPDPSCLGASLAVPASVGQVGGPRPLQTSWLVVVTFLSGRRAGEVHQFRWFKQADAKRCMRDFADAKKELRVCHGHNTFSGWVDV